MGVRGVNQVCKIVHLESVLCFVRMARHQCATMCVIMNDSKVGVRELRQNLSIYLRRVKAGEALEVTDRGNVVALLVPLPDPDTPLERLIASGRATRPMGSLAELTPPDGEPSTMLTRALQDEREERN